MLNLAPGEYQSTICNAVQADGLLIGLTNYVRDQLVTSLHTHENPHLSFGLKGRMVVSRKSLSGLKSNIEQFSYVHAGEARTIPGLPQAKHLYSRRDGTYLYKVPIDKSK